MRQNLVSVIMPVYNTNPAYLREAIDSIRGQTYQDWELLVIDDCSTQRDVDAVMASYSDPRIKYFTRPVNEGAGPTRNFGLDHAEGEFIAFLDSDDMAVPARFEKQVAFLRAHLDIGIIGSEHTFVPSRKHGVVVGTDWEIKACAMFLRCPASQSSVMLRRAVLDKSGVRYPVDISQDYAFWLDLTMFTKSENIQEPLILYRWHGDNISIRKARQQYVMNRQIIMNKWQEVYSITVPKEVEKFLFLDMRSPAELAQVEQFFSELMVKINGSTYTKPDLALKYLGKLYRKTLRKYKSGAMIRAMLKSTLAQQFKLGIGFKIQMFFKSLLMKEEE